MVAPSGDGVETALADRADYSGFARSIFGVLRTFYRGAWEIRVSSNPERRRLESGSARLESSPQRQALAPAGARRRPAVRAGRGCDGCINRTKAAFRRDANVRFVQRLLAAAQKT